MTDIVIKSKPERPIVVETEGPGQAVTVTERLGRPGQGVPAGGAVGEFLRKSGTGDYSTEWAPVTATADWSTITGKPTFATVATTGAYSDLTGLPTLFSGAWADLTGKPATFPPEAHTHSDATTSVAGFMSTADKTKLDGIAAGANNYVHPNHTGDVTSTGDGATTIAAGAVSLSKMADLATSTFLGRASGGTGSPEALSVATAKALLSLSGTNTGDQTITLTGDVTGSGTGSFAATIGAGTVTLAKMANMATASLIYRKTAGTGAPEVQTLATLKTDLGLTGTNSGDQTITLTGDVTGSGTGSFAATIGAGTVTLSKMANLATSTILGRVTAGSGAPEALTGTQATGLLDVFTSGAKGLAPASGGGTTNFLRADGTWAAPSGGGGVSDGDKGDIVVSGGGTAWAIDSAVWTGARTIAGNWTFGDGTAATDLFINGAAATARSLWLRTAGSNRWRFYANTTAESGGNAGSNFAITSYDDSGTLIGNVLSVSRSTRVVDFSQTPTVGGVPIGGSGGAPQALAWVI